VNKGYRNVLTLFSLAILVLGLMPGRVAGQAISGDIVGTVVDRTGAAVPGASIEVANVATGVKTSTTSRDQGDFRFGNLPVGTYTTPHSSGATAMPPTMRILLCFHNLVDDAQLTYNL
jgi:hypothetical protein